MEFALVHRRLVAYLDTITPYLQLRSVNTHTHTHTHTHTSLYPHSLQEECNESVCGVQLTDVNMQLINALPQLVAIFSTTDNYISLIARG